MKGTKLEFRLRLVIFFVIIFLGFWAPWERWWSAGEVVPSTWSTLARLSLSTGNFSFFSATIMVVSLATLCALLGALLRTWATAYLGADIVLAKQMQAGSVMADGPYRYVRNPLYLGMQLNLLALAILMPVSGAVFTVVTAFLFQLRLIGGEEAHLHAKLGDAYTAYVSKVPRLLPSLRPRIAGSGAQPHWPQAFLSEIYMWGAVVSFAALAWRYNAHIIMQGILVSFGVSLIARAVLPAKQMRLPENRDFAQ
ncbi:MAG: methyltransferase family protein [Acidobacteriaceae bacterium]